MNKKLWILLSVLVFSAAVVLANYDSRPSAPGPYPPLQGNGPSFYSNRQGGNFHNAPPPQMNGNMGQYGQYGDRRPPRPPQMNDENRQGFQNGQPPRPSQMNGGANQYGQYGDRQPPNPYGQPPQFNGNNQNSPM